MAPKTLDQHIEATPGICGGKPRIAGHRITVQNIVIWHERLGRCADEIASEYNLDLADVHAALAYYFDHREEIDESIEQSRQWIEETKRNATRRRLSLREAAALASTIMDRAESGRSLAAAEEARKASELEMPE